METPACLIANTIEGRGFRPSRTGSTGITRSYLHQLMTGHVKRPQVMAFDLGAGRRQVIHLHRALHRFPRVGGRANS